MCGGSGRVRKKPDGEKPYRPELDTEHLPPRDRDGKCLTHQGPCTCPFEKRHDRKQRDDDKPDEWVGTIESQGHAELHTKLHNDFGAMLDNMQALDADVHELKDVVGRHKQRMAKAYDQACVQRDDFRLAVQDIQEQSERIETLETDADKRADVILSANNHL